MPLSVCFFLHIPLSAYLSLFTCILISSYISLYTCQQGPAVNPAGHLPHITLPLSHRRCNKSSAERKHTSLCWPHIVFFPTCRPSHRWYAIEGIESRQYKVKGGGHIQHKGFICLGGRIIVSQICQEMCSTKIPLPCPTVQSVWWAQT